MMKRISLIFITFVMLIAHSFAGGADFFDHRIFEIKLNVPVNVSNNTLSVADFLQKEVIIDLKELYEGMPKKGFDITVDAMPSAGFALDFKKGIHFGVEAGVDIFSKVGVSKDLFRFIAKGNELNEEITVSVNGYADVFAFTNLDIGFNLKRFNIRVQPAVFASIAHAVTTDSYVKASNGEDNSYNLVMNSNMDIYSSVPVTQELFGDTNLMVNQLINQLVPTMGFDMSGQVSYKLTDFLKLTGSVRIPLAPSRLNYKTAFNYSSEYSVSVEKLMGKGDSEEGENGETTGESTPAAETPTTESEPAATSLFSDPINEIYKINRPMKFSISANFTPFSWLMSYYGTLGIGIKHPGAKNRAETYAYVDYLIGTKLSLINIISLYLSTERTDEIYKHKATLALNFRLVEVDAGLAFESANLQTSFKGSGLGAFVTACIGF